MEAQQKYGEGTREHTTREGVDNIGLAASAPGKSWAGPDFALIFMVSKNTLAEFIWFGYMEKVAYMAK